MTIKCDPNLDVFGTSYHGKDIVVDPKVLMDKFPDYTLGDEYKVTKNWSFLYKNKVFCVYDWKETSVYDPNLPTPNRFWGDEKVRLNVASRFPSYEDDFIQALVQTLET